MKKQLFIGVLGALVILSLCSCATKYVIIPKTANMPQNGSGTQLGVVSATATVSYIHTLKKIIGDTFKYGTFGGDLKINDLVLSETQKAINSGKTIRINDSISEKAVMFVTEGPVSIATTNAFYDIIEQVLAKGGDAVSNIITLVDREYDEKTKTETATVTVTAIAMKITKEATE